MTNSTLIDVEAPVLLDGLDNIYQNNNDMRAYNEVFNVSSAELNAKYQDFKLETYLDKRPRRKNDEYKQVLVRTAYTPVSFQNVFNEADTASIFELSIIPILRNGDFAEPIEIRRYATKDAASLGHWQTIKRLEYQNWETFAPIQLPSLKNALKKVATLFTVQLR